MVDEKDLLRAHIMSPDSVRKGERIDDKATLNSTRESNGPGKANIWAIKEAEEDALIALVDNKKLLKKILPILQSLDAGKMDVTTAINKASKLAFAEGLKMMFLSQSDKVKADLAKHFLALAGHTPTQKIELGRIDPETPRSALISMISGAEQDLKSEGIELVDDREAKSQGTGDKE